MSQAKETVTDTPSPGFDALSASLKQLTSNPVNFQNTSGFFVRRAAIAAIDKEMNRLVEAGLPAEDEAQLRATIEKLNNGIAVAKEAMIAEVEKAKVLKAGMEKAKETLDQFQAANEGLQTQLKLELASKKELQAAAKLANNEAKIASKKVNRFDDAAAVKLLAEHDATQVALKEATNEVNSLTGKLTAANNELDKVKKDHAGASKAFIAQATLVEALKAERASSYSDMPVTPKIEIKLNEGWLKTTLGDKGLDWFKRAAEEQECNVRERTFNMLNALRGAKSDKVITGLRGLLALLFDWIKTRTHKLRVSITPWLNMVQSDLAAGTLKSLEHYRKELEKIIGDIKVEIEKARTHTKKLIAESEPMAGKDYYGGFFFEARLWAHVLYNRATRPVKKTASSLYGKFKRTVKSTSNVVSRWLRNLFVPVHSPVGEKDAVIYDVDSIDESTPLSSENAWEKPKKFSKAYVAPTVE